MVGTNQPSFIACDSFESRHQFMAYDKGGLTHWLQFEEHVQVAYPDWHIPVAQENARSLLWSKSYEAFWNRIGVDLCNHHGMSYCSYAEGLVKKMREAHTLQLAVLLDTTHSMKGEIRQCQTDLNQLVANINTGLKNHGMNPQVEVAFIAYKDKRADGELEPGHLVGLDFGKDLDTVKKIINRQSASGGGAL